MRTFGKMLVNLALVWLTVGAWLLGLFVYCIIKRK